ncbi:21356_t:CDS:2 [Rhizophagus irregularis]|nr:21356_t:CDS:2 [Rhizophagus irregularis]
MSLEKCFVIVPLLIAESTRMNLNSREMRLLGRTSHTETLSQSRTGPFVLVVSDEIRGRSSTSDDSTKNRGKIFSSKSFKVKIFWINCSTIMKTLKRASGTYESDDLSEAEDDGIEDAIIDAGQNEEKNVDDNPWPAEEISHTIIIPPNLHPSSANAESDAEGLDGDEQMSASDYEKLRQRYNNR